MNEYELRTRIVELECEIEKTEKEIEEIVSRIEARKILTWDVATLEAEKDELLLKHSELKSRLEQF